MLQSDVFFMFSTLGEMGVKDVISECQAQGWMPLLVFRPKATTQPTLIPCFKTREQAIQFGKRNLPKTHLFGTAILTDEDKAKLAAEWVEKRNWRFLLLDHPRLLKNLGTFDVEVYEPTHKPDVYGLAGKNCQHTKALSYSL